MIEYAKSLAVTKISFLRWASQIFDSLGFLSPYMVKLKFLFQVMCLDKLDWDSEILGDLCKQWDTVMPELEFLNDIPVLRCYSFSNQKSLAIQLHGFSNASEHEFAAVVYLGKVYENDVVDLKLMASKTKVAPARKQMIPIGGFSNERWRFFIGSIL